MSYKAYLMDAVSRIQQDFGDYVPSKFPAGLLSRLDDETAYQFVNAWRDMTANNYHASQRVPRPASGEGENERLHLRFEFTKDGFRLVNTRTGGIETLYSIASGGGFDYDGRRKDAFLLGGRSEVGGIPQVAQTIYEKLHDHDIRR